jgi:radical SAM/Cys-rich protein
VNPSGAFLPPEQAQMEKRFHNVLEQKWGIVFNKLFSFANVPLGRFRSWLIASNNMQKYMERLAGAFNPCTVEGLMCRTLISVSWDGYLFDCDFNQATRQFMGNRKTHISEIDSLPEAGAPISTDNHCYTCTAGSGFT